MFIGWNTMQNLKQEFSELLSKKGNHNITNIDSIIHMQLYHQVSAAS